MLTGYRTLLMILLTMWTARRLMAVVVDNWEMDEYLTCYECSNSDPGCLSSDPVVLKKYATPCATKAVQCLVQIVSVGTFDYEFNMPFPERIFLRYCRPRSPENLYGWPHDAFSSNNQGSAARGCVKNLCNSFALEGALQDNYTDYRDEHVNYKAADSAATQAFVAAEKASSDGNFAKKAADDASRIARDALGASAEIAALIKKSVDTAVRAAADAASAVKTAQTASEVSSAARDKFPVKVKAATDGAETALKAAISVANARATAEAARDSAAALEAQVTASSSSATDTGNGSSSEYTASWVVILFTIFAAKSQSSAP